MRWWVHSTDLLVPAPNFCLGASGSARSARQKLSRTASIWSSCQLRCGWPLALATCLGYCSTGSSQLACSGWTAAATTGSSRLSAAAAHLVWTASSNLGFLTRQWRSSNQCSETWWYLWTGSVPHPHHSAWNDASRSLASSLHWLLR